MNQTIVGGKTRGARNLPRASCFEVVDGKAVEWSEQAGPLRNRRRTQPAMKREKEKEEKERREGFRRRCLDGKSEVEDDDEK